MPDNQRIEDLRRRILADPASIAFAQLAEELRRAGQLQESVEVGRAGLSTHPGYLSARITIGRALLELNRLDEAEQELRHVLANAPENLAALRGLGEIAQRRGAFADALGHFRLALSLAKYDPDLEHTVAELAEKVEPEPPVAPPSTVSRFTATVAANPPSVAPAALVSAVASAGPERMRTVRTLDALEQWLDAIHVARTQPRA